MQSPAYLHIWYHLNEKWMQYADKRIIRSTYTHTHTHLPPMAHRLNIQCCFVIQYTCSEMGTWKIMVNNK